MRLVALRGIQDSVGYIEPGQEFETSAEHAKSLIDAGQAQVRGKAVDQKRAGWREWAILASGPSLTTDDVELVRRWRSADGQRRVIVVNTTFRLAPWADILYACDLQWWDAYAAEVFGVFEGQPWSQTEIACRRYNLAHIKGEPGAGLSRQRGLIRQGGNSGYQAIGLAFDQGAERIVLLGFDMQNTDGRTHWHGDHPAGLRNTSPFTSWTGKFGQLAVDLEREGVRVINATRETALRCFERMPAEEALA